MTTLEDYEDGLRVDLERRLAKIPGCARVQLCPAAHADAPVRHRRPDSADLYRFLAARGVNAPAGSFYALEASRWLGLGDNGAVRAGLAPYSTADDTDRLVEGVIEFAR